MFFLDKAKEGRSGGGNGIESRSGGRNRTGKEAERPGGGRGDDRRVRQVGGAKYYGTS